MYPQILNKISVVENWGIEPLKLLKTNKIVFRRTGPQLKLPELIPVDTV